MSEQQPTLPAPDVEAAAHHFEQFMSALGIDADTAHTARTPERVAESRAHELFSGLHVDPREHLSTTFPAGEGDDEFVVVDNIEVVSTCAHHFLPFTGRAHVGYIPAGRIVGLSKLARVVDGFARRPQVQERLTGQIADAVYEELEPQAVVVAVDATHECMRLRGVREPNSTTRTCAIRGAAQEEPDVKQEFFDIIRRA